MTDEIIEKCLQSAKDILFDLPKDLNRQPNVIAIGFKEFNQFIKDVADYLNDNAASDCTMYIEPSDTGLSFSLIDEKQARVFNVKDMKYDKLNFEMFKRRQRKDGKFVFTFYIPQGKLLGMLPYKNGQPFHLLINGYTLPSEEGGKAE